jgi:hypothetical protein
MGSAGRVGQSPVSPAWSPAEADRACARPSLNGRATEALMRVGEQVMEEHDVVAVPELLFKLSVHDRFRFNLNTTRATRLRSVGSQ